MANITSLGSGSGLALEDMLQKLQTAEEKKLTLITNRQSSVNAQISAYSKIQNAIEAVQKAALALGEPATLGAVKSTVSSDALTVKTEAGAVAGDYKVDVSQLAQAQVLKSGPVSNRTAQMGSGGEMTLTLAGGTINTVQLGDDTSLDGVAKAINASDETDVRATIVTDNNGDSYLLLTSKTTGTQAAVKSITSDNAVVNDVVAFDTAGGTSNLTEEQKATNALLTINDISVESQTNIVTGAIDGVTLTLTGTTAASISISSDPSVTSKAVQSFVDAYNTLQSTFTSLTAFDVSAKTQSVLTGDGTTRNIQSTLAAALRVVSGEGSLQTLSQLGVTSDPKTGQLKLDQTKLDKALADNPADVARVFGGTGGLAKKMDMAAKGFMSDQGAIKTRTDGLAETVESLQDQYDRSKRQIDATMDLYRAQFSKLDVLVAQMQNTSNYLTQQFAALAKSAK